MQFYTFFLFCNSLLFLFVQKSIQFFRFKLGSLIIQKCSLSLGDVVYCFPIVDFFHRHMLQSTKDELILKQKRKTKFPMLQISTLQRIIFQRIFPQKLQNLMTYFLFLGNSETL